MLSIIVNISITIVLLTININNKVNFLGSLVVSSLEGVEFLTNKFTLKKTIVVIVQLPGIFLSRLLEVIIEESSFSLRFVITLQLQLTRWWPVRVVLTVGHEFNIGLVEGAIPISDKLEVTRVLSTKQEANFIVYTEVKETISNLVTT